MQALLPKYFGVLPKAAVEIRRVPTYTEAGSPGGYYQPPTLDGSRPGAYYINLRDTAEQPSWVLPTLTYHEAIPGHHLQGTIALEADTPLIRKLQFFSGYLEGWGLYAEQLADEIGLYADDPLGRLGYLHDALFRAVRSAISPTGSATRIAPPSPKSNATVSGRARPAPTCWASSRSSDCAPRPAPGWGRASTCASSMTPC